MDSNQVEVSAKTVDDARSQAAARLGVPRDQIEFEVLDEGKRGFLGRGGRDATIRAWRAAPGAAAPAGAGLPDTRIPRGAQGRGSGERGQRPRGAGRGGRGAAPGGGGRAPGGAQRGRTGFEAPVPKLREEDFIRPRGEPAAEGAPPAAPRGDGQRASAPPREGRPRRERERERRPRAAEAGPPIEPDINAEEVDFAAHVVDDVLRILGIEGEITIREPITIGDGRGTARAVIDISGDDLGMLIGRRGDSLHALQYLVNLIVQQKYPDRGMITIDIEHYRHRNEERIVSMATRMADRVRETGRAITLEPMAPSERRIIHVMLQDDPELETNSIGEGLDRKVVISARRQGGP